MKKVLVIDEIKCCRECFLCHETYYYYKCGYTHINLGNINELLPNCPLKDLPSKLELPNYAHESYYHYNKGWNDLLDEIENQK